MYTPTRQRSILGSLLVMAFVWCTPLLGQVLTERDSHPSHGFLGIHARNIDRNIAAQLGLGEAAGVIVVNVLKGSPAEMAGLTKDDVLLEFDGDTFDDWEELLELIRDNEGNTVLVEGRRGNTRLKVSVAIGVKGTDNPMTVTSFEAEMAGDQAVKAGRTRESIDHYVKALNDYPGDANFRLREKTIVAVQRLTVPPATPESAERALVIAKATQAESKGLEDDNKAIRNYLEASYAAPWLAEVYFNLALLWDKSGDNSSAVSAFKFYLLAAPDAEDSQRIRERIIVLEDRQKDNAAASVAAARRVAAAEEEEADDALWELLGALFGVALALALLAGS